MAKTANSAGSPEAQPVRGFADQRLRKKEAPLDPSNRRISLIVQYLPKKPSESDAKGEKAEGVEGKSEGGEGKSEKSEAKPEKTEAKSESKPAESKSGEKK